MRPSPPGAPVLVAEGLAKSFRHRTSDRPQTFRAWAESGFRRDAPEGRTRALDDVSFELHAGETLGVIGRNGSGKSTLLRLLGGVMRPDGGRVRAAAPPNGLLDLNAGMHPDLSGRENILIGGVLAGLLKEEVRAREADIIAFAELEDHIDDPVRTYSAGMRLRLGFAVAVHVEPRLLLIDEVLSVGDLAFQQKCLERIREFKDRGCAIVLISHDLQQVGAFCDRCLWLDRGRLRQVGAAGPVVEAYTRAMEEAHRRTDRTRPDRATDTGVTLRAGENWLGTQEAQIAGVTIRGPDGRPAASVEAGSALGVEMALAVPAPVGPVHAFVSIAGAGGRTVLDVNTDGDRADLPVPTDGTVITVTFDRLDLAPGDYRVSVGIWAAGWDRAYDHHQDAYPLAVTGRRSSEGPLLPPRRWRVARAPRPPPRS